MKKTILLLCTCMMALGSFAQTNLALNKPASASSGTASSAVDGNTGTRWESSQTDDEWWYVDLESAHEFNTLQIVWEGAYTKSFEIYTATELDSENNPLWGATPVYTVTDHTPAIGGDGQMYKLDNAVTARFVKFVVKARGTVWGNSFFEFRIYNLEDAKLGSVSAAAAESSVLQGLEVNLTHAETATNGNTFYGAEVAWEVTPAAGASVTDNVFRATQSGNYSIVAVATADDVTVRSEAVVVNVSKNVAQGAAVVTNDFVGVNNGSFGVDGDWNNLFGIDNPAADDEETRAKLTTALKYVIDLGAAYDLTSLYIKFDANADDYTISVSLDNKEYTEVVAETAIGAIYNQLKTYPVNVLGRYIKLTTTKPNNINYGIKIRELAASGVEHHFEGTLETVSLTASATSVFVGESVVFTTEFTDNYNQAFEVSTVKWIVNGEEQDEEPDVAAFAAGTYTIAVKGDDITSAPVTIVVRVDDNVALGGGARTNWTDGKLNTQSDLDGNGDAIIDLGVQYNLTSILVDFGSVGDHAGYYGKNFSVYVSADGENYGDAIFTKTDATSAEAYDIEGTFNNVQYIKIHNNGTVARLFEVKAYGTVVAGQGMTRTQDGNADIYSGVWVSQNFVGTTDANFIDLRNVTNLASATVVPDVTNPNALFATTYPTRLSRTNAIFGENNDTPNYSYASNLVLADGSDPYQLNAGFNGSYNATYTRNFTAGFATLALPFAADVPEGVSVYTLVSADETKATFSKVGSIEAGKPYIVKVAEAGNVTFTRSEGNINYTANDVTAGTLTFHPVFAEQQLTDGYALQGSTGSSVDLKTVTSVAVRAFRGYFTSNSSDGDVKGLSIVFDDLATGVGSLDSNRPTSGPVFDITGRRVNTPAKGIYVVNGRKVVLK